MDGSQCRCTDTIGTGDLPVIGMVTAMVIIVDTTVDTIMATEQDMHEEDTIREMFIITVRPV